MTHDTMRALAQLPHASGYLDLTNCTWPLRPTEYKQLARHVPTSFKAWRVRVHVFSLVLHCVCAGVNEHRGGLGLPPLEVYVCGHKGADTKVGEHAVVKAFSW